jgi:hypothetical protein
VDKKKEQLVGIVGAQHVLDDPRTLESYASDQSFVAPLRPWFVVRPKNVEEVQALVIWANQDETPLVPVSSGPPHFHGDTVPTVPQAVIVDLSRMKAIRRIDRRNKMVVIEPGVTYGELEPALAKEGLRISRPLLPRANKSVIASLLERQPTLIPRLNFTLPDPLRTCGAVWGSGEIAYTGEAGRGPLSLEAQWERGSAQVNSTGPASTDLIRLLTGAQGSMGIVVWASVKCELLPSVHKYLFAAAAKLEHLIDICCRLNRIRLGDELMIFNRAQLAAILSKQPGDVKAIREELPAWSVVIGLGGAAYYPQERVVVQEKQLKSLAREFGVQLLDALPGIPNADVVNTIGSISAEPYWKLTRKGGAQDIFFLSTLDKAAQFIQTVNSIAEECGYPLSDICIYIQPQHQGVSHHVEFSFPYQPTDDKEVAKIKEVYVRASQALIGQGAYFSRPYGLWADLVYNRDASASRVLKAVKQIVDPKNVMNPGKLCF